tara:strand:+ start:7371 stop:7559 length:189 start_codon:yes stop_codon:yes gene_type:complete
MTPFNTNNQAIEAREKALSETYAADIKTASNFVQKGQIATLKGLKATFINSAITGGIKVPGT